MNRPLKFVVSILILLATLFISGCLVDEDSPVRTIDRNTDILHTFSDGDFYEYFVDAQATTAGNTQFFDGSLTVQYTVTTLPEPFATGGIISPVLQEDSTLMLGGAIYNLRRYLQQAPGGALSVLAVQYNGTLYRAGNSIYTPQAVEIIQSPLPTEQTTVPTIAFDYMAGCESAAPSNCNSTPAQSINKALVYQGDAIARTLEGDFVAIRIDFSGSFTSGSAPALFDILGACDQDAATFFGAEYISPAVGVVRIENACIAAGGGSGHSYTARLSNTNVPIP